MEIENLKVKSLKLIAGWLCLDFANTLGMHSSDTPREYIKTYKDLIEWSQHAGIISDVDINRLLKRAEENPVEAEKVLQDAIRMREVIFRIFSSIAASFHPRRKDIVSFNQYLSKIMKISKIKPVESGYEWDILGNKDSLDWMLNAIIHSAFLLLTSDSLDRVKICADASGCGWLFLDHSKNRSRRWCDMSDCGNKAKSKRFYHKKSKTLSKGTLNGKN